VDLRRLPRDWPIPRTPSELGADYHVVAHVPTDRRGSIGGAADARFVTSQIAGATIADGSTAGASWQNGELAYRADVTVAGVDLKRIGEAFSLPALESDQYSSAINGHIVADGHGTTPQALALTASGTLNDTEVIGARVPELAFDATIGHDMAHVKAGGTFENLDPARPTGKTALQGAVSGRLDLDATIEGFSQGVTVDNAAARARLDLGRSSVGGLDIDHATLDGSYERSTGEVRTLEIVGSDVNVSASGRLALDETGQSNLMVHADSSKLETIARLFDQPLTGMARVDSTVTGNRRELHASGTAATNDLDFQGSGALAASTEFTATLSDLDPETASITATTRATLVNVGGQHVNELTLETSYARRAVNFDASARQPERSVTGAGSLLFNPDGQEVQVKSLGFESRGVRWQTAAGGRPTVRYSGGKIAVDDLQLVNDNQRASVSGAFGAPGDTLNVTLADVDLSTVDALLLRPPQLTGRLNGSARISGTMNDPTVKAELKVADGGYGQIRYETLGATLIYGANGIDIDAQLQQNPTTSITVKGYAPLAASAVRPEFDIRVDSSPIDLGLFQELIPQVTNLKGTLQATVNVTGPFGDPRPLGAVTIGNAGFTVPLTGAAYSELGGRIDFQPDKVHIGELRVLDNQRHALTVTGDLALREREVGGVAIEVTSKDFKIIDNKMGNARIDSSLRIAGELMAARIEGDLKVATGQLNLDPILALVADRAYATQETSLTADAGVDQTQAPSAFDALAMYVRFQVPNDLVIKASDVKVPGSPIGLGGLNVTVGSDLFLNKSPWDQFRLIGTVNTVRGTYDFQGRRFTILRDGKIRFQGLDEFDAGLDIRAERVIQAVTATINVRGTLRQPELALSSVPPLEEADILSLIVFNQPINQLGTGQQASLAASAQAMALGAAAGQVSQSIGKALGLDTFEVNLAPETGATPEVTIGQQVGQNLYLKVQQGIGDQGQTNVILEYELTRWLRFRTNYLQGPTSQAQLFQRLQGSGLDLLFFFSF
jgi:autotransporter translocation and assembly factor TamB